MSSNLYHTSNKGASNQEKRAMKPVVSTIRPLPAKPAAIGGSPADTVPRSLHSPLAKCHVSRASVHVCTAVEHPRQDLSPTSAGAEAHIFFSPAAGIGPVVGGLHAPFTNIAEILEDDA